MSMFSIQFKIINLLGFVDPQKVPSDRMIYFPIFVKNFSVFAIIFCFIGESWFIIDNIEDVMEAVEAAVPLFITFTSAVKLFYYWIWEKKLLELAKKLKIYLHKVNKVLTTKTCSYFLFLLCS